MAAAIRYASRRLVSYVLQRTQTELPRRLIHSGPPPAASSRRPIPSGATHPPISNAELPAARSQDGKMDALRQIRKKKQELYDQIAMTERRYDTGLWGEGFQNRQLLQHLSVQIEPKPNDPVWRSNRRAKRITNVMMFTLVSLSTYTLGTELLDSHKEAGAPTGKIAPAVNNP
ncbi:uncharacterized protein LOC124668027 [Lolium rigidum]|uniref:uncharacterized protein LOC124668027 n=1 Tax=Lolium rigidum TaxID=89674 RepID=UPI001F5D731A|nr:uncharacterized protein LOC124668027 [Lolium rigidum]